jgi:hypothetical protein
MGYVCLAQYYFQQHFHHGRDRMVVRFTTTYAIQCLSSLMLWVRISIGARCTNEVCQWLATGQWFSPGPPASSTNRADRRGFNWNIVENGVKHHQTNKQTVIYWPTVLNSGYNCIKLPSLLISLTNFNLYRQGVNVRHNWKPFCALEGKFLLIALVIVRITLNVIVRQMPLNVH